MSIKSFHYKEDEIKKIPYVELGYKEKNSSHSIKVAVKNGNNLFSYIIDKKEVIFYDASLPMASFAVGNPLLFPFPNRIENAMWTWKGKTYLQKKDGIPIQLHSLIYDETSFNYDTPIITKNSITLKTYIDVDDSHPIFKGYPFNFRLVFNFILTKKGINIEYVLENQSDSEMPFGVGFHPYFNKLSGEDETKITVPMDYYYETRTDVDKEFFNKLPNGFGMTGNVLPTGKLKKARKTKYDLLYYKKIGELDLDTAYTNKDKNPSAYIDYIDKGLKIVISCSDEFKHYVVYTPQGKKFFCIEPQTCSTDAINLYNKGVKHTGLLICPSKEIKKGLVSINFKKY